MTNAEGQSPGVLLVGHGTRDPQGLDEFREVVRQVRERLQPRLVEAAFLELADPPIAAGMTRLYERGAREIIVAPLLLFAAGHARRDIPAAVAEAASRFPELTWKQAEHLGCHPALLELSRERIAAALAGSPPLAATDAWIVVGRGSQDPEAIAETHRYAELVSQQFPDLIPRVAFLAMAEPRLSAVLAEIAAGPAQTVLVQPHLLFHGELLGQIEREVSGWRSAGQKRWVVAGHLGTDPRVATAVEDRVAGGGWRVAGSR